MRLVYAGTIKQSVSPHSRRYGSLVPELLRTLFYDQGRNVTNYVRFRQEKNGKRLYRNSRIKNACVKRRREDLIQGSVPSANEGQSGVRPSQAHIPTKAADRRAAARLLYVLVTLVPCGRLWTTVQTELSNIRRDLNRQLTNCRVLALQVGCGVRHSKCRKAAGAICWDCRSRRSGHVRRKRITMSRLAHRGTWQSTGRHRSLCIADRRLPPVRARK